MLFRTSMTSEKKIIFRFPVMVLHIFTNWEKRRRWTFLYLKSTYLLKANNIQLGWFVKAFDWCYPQLISRYCQILLIVKSFYNLWQLQPQQQHSHLQQQQLYFFNENQNDRSVLDLTSLRPCILLGVSNIRLKFDLMWING